MQHLGTQILETERLVLRPLQITDAQMMFDNWATDPEVTRYVTWEPYTSVEQVLARLKLRVAYYEETKAFYDWGIVLKESQELIGTFSIVNISEQDEAVELGYCIGQLWWGQGIVAEAGRAVLAFVFHELGCHRAHACFDVRNPASGEVMKKLGMTYEGTFREARKVKGEFVTISQYSILSKEF